MKKLVAFIVAVAALLGAAPAQAHLAYKPKDASLEQRLVSQTLNLKHARYVAEHGKGEHKRWAVKAVGWLSRERNETRVALAPKVPPGCWSDNPNVELGNRMAKPYGWHRGSEWCALYKLWNHESGWSERADNPNSDACGIPQRMDNCQTYGYNPRKQIGWGLGYISGRYGSPSGAYSHLRSFNFY